VANPRNRRFKPSPLLRAPRTRPCWRGFRRSAANLQTEKDLLAEGAGFELSVLRGKKAFESGNLVLNRQDTGEHRTISALLITSRSGRIVDDRNKGAVSFGPWARATRAFWRG
jgi:hypothetical protein